MIYPPYTPLTFHQLADMFLSSLCYSPDMDERIRRQVDQIDRIFASDCTSEERIYAANELFKVIARLNRMVAEARGIGRDSDMPPPPVGSDALAEILDEHR